MLTERRANDFSFGIIPIRQFDGDLQFLLIQHLGGHWAFPKGHKEAGEDDLDAARRELHEETGLDDVIIPLGVPSFEETYTFLRRRRTVVKSVRYFLGIVRGGDVVLQESEVKDYAWLPYEGAMELTTFPESQRLLRSAYEYLLTHNLLGRTETA